MSALGHYEAETCHTGGYLCGHRHRTRSGAERCLPRLPRQTSTLTRYFSMARVIWRGDGPDPWTAADEDERRYAER